jgi:hypothetical protein
MPTDPESGLPTDDNGNILDAEDAGSNTLTDMPQPEAADNTIGLDGAPLAASSTPSSNVRGKISIDQKGLPGGAKRAGDLFSQAEAQAAADAAPYQSEYDNEAARANRDYGLKAEGVAEEGGLTRDYYDRERELHDRQRDFLHTQADLEKQAAVHAEIEAHKHIAAYKEQLAGVRQLIQTSGDPTGNLTMGQAAGLSFGAFAQGFLAARGIQIDVTGQIDRWVNRKIQEHQMMVQNARESANDQLHLYEIARQTSQDDYEARQRYRGFVVEGLKTSILANASRFNSDVAMSRAKTQVAALDLEANQTEASIYERRRGMQLGFLHLRIGEAAQRGQLEIQNSHLALERYRAETARRAAENKGGGLKPLLDIEPTVGADGKEHYRVLGYVDPKDQNAMKVAREDRTFADNMFKALNQLEKSRKVAYEKYGGAPMSGKVASVNSPEIRNYERDRLAAIQAIRLATTGKAFTAEEKKEYEELLPGESAWQKGNNELAIPQMKEAIRAKFEGAARSYLVAGDQGQSPGDITAAPQARSEWKAMSEGGAPIKKLTDVPENASKSGDWSHTKPSKAWSALMEGDQPANTHAVDVVAHIAANPVLAQRVLKDEKKYSIPEDPGILYKQAMESLQNMAERGDTYVSGYASIVLSKLKTDPDGFTKLFADEPPELTGEYKAKRLPRK